MLDPKLERWIREHAEGSGLVLFLTGAGISAESGIPTFRGEEGYWQVGSRNYRPMELATVAAFRDVPDDVWGWYLYRRGVCAAAEPNTAHRALVRLEERLADRFLLVTQNVDGLHSRAGNTPARILSIHGDINRMRCAEGCCRELWPVPPEIELAWEKGRLIDEPERLRLRCPRCQSRARPHVLWFDEYYDEDWFRFESSMAAAERADLLVIVGTSGSTTLPDRILRTVKQRSARVLVIDPQPTVFSEAIAGYAQGRFLQDRASSAVPAVVDVLAI